MYWKVLRTYRTKIPKVLIKIRMWHPNILGNLMVEISLDDGIQILKGSNGRGWVPSVSVPLPGVLINVSIKINIFHICKINLKCQI